MFVITCLADKDDDLFDGSTTRKHEVIRRGEKIYIEGRLFTFAVGYWLVDFNPQKIVQPNNNQWLEPVTNMDLMLALTNYSLDKQVISINICNKNSNAEGRDTETQRRRDAER